MMTQPADRRLLTEAAGNATYGTRIGGDAPAGGWHLDTSTPPPPLIPGTLAVSGVTSTGFALAASGVSGDLHATPYSFTIDGGTTWSAWQAVPTYEVSGRTPATAHVCRHRVRGSDGTLAVGYTTLTVNTNSLTFEVLTSDSFSVAAPNLIGQPTDSALGGTVKTWESTSTLAVLAKVDGSLVRGADLGAIFVAIPNDTADQSLIVQFDSLLNQGQLHMTLRRTSLSGPESIRLYIKPGSAQLAEVTASSEVRNIGSPIPLTGPCELELRAEGTTATVFKDGTQALQDSTLTVSAAGFAGFAHGSGSAGGFSIGHIILKNKI